MTVQQAFGVAVRSIGVFWLGYGITTIGFCFFTSQSSALNSAFGGGAAVIAGVILMLKAERVVKLCYTTYDEFGYPVDEAEKPRA